jgi:hypothetical protein
MIGRGFDRLTILVAVRRFPRMGVANSRSFRFESYVRMQHFDRRTTISFGVLGGCAARVHATSFCYSSNYQIIHFFVTQARV